MQADANAPESVRRVAEALRDLLVRRLDEIHGLLQEPTAPELALVTPVVVEVGDELVPIVDSRADGGVFLYELIPAMRERIRTSMGVVVPGVRMRGNPNLPPDGYSIQVDEVPVRAGTAPRDVTRVVVRPDGNRAAPGGVLTGIHPLTGEPGLWALNPVSNGDSADDAPRLSPAEYLIHQIELVLRSHLARLLGPEEVDDLVREWATVDENLVSTVLPDREAKLRVTWLLQALVDDSVPIDRWQELLAAVRDAGGLGAPLRTLLEATRSRLREHLSDERAGRMTIVVPEELQAGLYAPTSGNDDPTRDPRHEFMLWLREVVDVSGPALALVATDEESRERVGALARAGGELIMTLSESEVASP
jgi:flagellar biosynthesis component FlhA